MNKNKNAFGVSVNILSKLFNIIAQAGWNIVDFD